ncbi:MAG: glycosyltransferase family 4 protein [Pyrinomonadaceae bacterium]
MKVLLLNQCFYPDVVSAGQHLTDLAVGLAERGDDVTVVASRRGYDNPQMRFPKKEVWKGIKIIRLPSFGLGKKAKWRRALDFASFLASCVLRLILLPRYDVVVAMTAPPLISFLAALFVKLRGGKFIYWVMDLNPDEAVAAGWLREDSFVAKALQAILIYALRHAETIVVLDRFMKQRIVAKGISPDKVKVIPPWSHDTDVYFERRGREEFRAKHGLTDKFVVMYSGNHSPCHPLDTLLDAAENLSDNPKVSFCFVGGGSEFQKVKGFAASRGLKNVICLPYQPLDKLAASLSAADLHVVVMGDPFTGIVHPCKIYNILRIGTPFLYIGPEESHIVDVLVSLNGEGVAHVARHGESEKVAFVIAKSANEAARMEVEAEMTLAARFSMDALLQPMIDALDSVTVESRSQISCASKTSA